MTDPDDLDFDLHAMYRIYDGFDRPLYFGETNNMPRRLSEHMEKAWFRRPDITIKITWFPNRAEAFAAQNRAIAAEKPWYNKAGLKAPEQQAPEVKRLDLSERRQRVTAEKQRIADEKRRMAEEEQRITEERERLIREQPPRDLLADLGMVMKDERARIRDVVALLRGLAPSYIPYERLTGVQLVADLKDKGVRTLNLSGRFYLDPADLRKVAA